MSRVYISFHKQFIIYLFIIWIPDSRTSQCHPPSPIAFMTVPFFPTSDDFVRLLPFTCTLVFLGNNGNSSPEPSFSVSIVYLSVFLLFQIYSSFFSRDRESDIYSDRQEDCYSTADSIDKSNYDCAQQLNSRSFHTHTHTPTFLSRDDLTRGFSSFTSLSSLSSDCAQF